MLQVISANRLTDGRIVYRAATGAWVPAIADAARHSSKEEAALALEAAKGDVAANIVIEVEPVELREGPGGLTPVTMRDKIRVAGAPTMPFAPQDSVSQKSAGQDSAGTAPASVKNEQNDVSI